MSRRASAVHLFSLSLRVEPEEESWTVLTSAGGEKQRESTPPCKQAISWALVTSQYRERAAHTHTHRHGVQRTENLLLHNRLYWVDTQPVSDWQPMLQKKKNKQTNPPKKTQPALFISTDAYRQSHTTISHTIYSDYDNKHNETCNFKWDISFWSEGIILFMCTKRLVEIQNPYMHFSFTKFKQIF